ELLSPYKSLSPVFGYQDRDRRLRVGRVCGRSGYSRIEFRSNPIIFKFCDWGEDRAIPDSKGGRREYADPSWIFLWKVSDYFAPAPTIGRTIVDGMHSMAAIPPRESLSVGQLP